MKSFQIISLSSLLLISCKSTSTDSQSIEDVLWPVEVGYEWIYEQLDGGTNNTIIFKVEELTEINGETYAVVDWSEVGYEDGNVDFDYKILVRNSEDGLYLGSKINKSYSIDEIFLAYPVQEGFEYTFSGPRGIHKVEVKLDKIFVPEGLHEVITYRISSYDSQRNREWVEKLSFAPKIGWVQELDSVKYFNGEFEFYYYHKLREYNFK